MNKILSAKIIDGKKIKIYFQCLDTHYTTELSISELMNITIEQAFTPLLNNTEDIIEKIKNGSKSSTTSKHS